MHARDHASGTARAPRGATAPARPVSRTAAARGAPPARDLRGLQRSVGNAAVSRMVDRRPAGAGEGPGVQRVAVQDVLRSPGTPLDAGLRTEMEARLGADFTDVRLHTGTAAQRSAADLGARAYTSGHHIVAGAGGLDKHTLAHELTHVVQQRSGPVAGTDRGDGVRVSDPGDRFERAAEATAHRVLAGPVPVRQDGGAHVPAEERDAAGAPVQRSVDWFLRDDARALDAFGTALGNLVEQAAADIMARPELVPVTNNGYVERWHKVFGAFIASERANTAFLYTAFGYAVEALTTARLSQVQGHLPAGWTLGTQVTHGHTRPDLVVFDAEHREQAWFDITASNSRGHIRDKMGAGWGTRPYVAEVVYPSLVVSALMPSSVTDEQRAEFAAAAAEEVRKEQQIVDHLQELAVIVHGAMEDDDEVGGDRAKQRRFFEEEMFLQLGEAATGAIRGGAKLPPAAAKSVLAYLAGKQRRAPGGQPWMAAFGYTRDQATGRDAVTFGRIVNELAVRGVGDDDAMDVGEPAAQGAQDAMEEDGMAA